MFVDDYHVASVKGLRRVVNPVEKHPPLMERKYPWEGLGPSFEYVHYDREAGIYKAFMTYAAYTTKEGRTHYWTGYATSKDGWKWERPAVGLPIPRGSGTSPDGVSSDLRSLFSKKFPGPRILGGNDSDFSDFEKTNIISMRTFAGYFVYDPDDPNPRKRYKSLQPFDAGPFGGPLRLYYSPNGLHDWTPYEKNPLSVAPIDDTYHIFHDARHKRYILFTRGAHGAGIGFYAESPDLKTWRIRPNKVELTADAADAPGTRIYGMTVFDYEGVYLGLPWVYNNNTMMRVGELAVSRDCVDWQRVDRTQPFIPLGPEGSPDSKLIFTAQSPPIIAGDQIRVFYTGQSGLHKPTTLAERGSYAMVGTLPLDRFADVELDAGSSRGQLRTHPFRAADVEGRQLVLNVAGELSPKSRLRVEIVEAGSGTPIAGCDLDKCDPIEKAGLRQTVSWQGNHRLAGLKGRDVALRFVFEADAGSPKLYSFAFK